VAATIAFPSIAVYSGTKSAVDRMTRVAAMEAGKLGFGVRVNCIYPGLIPTDMGMQLASDIVKVGLAPDVNAAVGSVVEQTRPARRGQRYRRRRGVSVLERCPLASDCPSTAAWACSNALNNHHFGGSSGGGEAGSITVSGC
jgi:NAD(P)-dependent dehydrogenase (short-subunit alcohol dehydrogenase family)